jgi:hypothetical protein
VPDATVSNCPKDHLSIEQRQPSQAMGYHGHCRHSTKTGKSRK